MKPYFLQPQMTPSYERILQRFISMMVDDESADVGHLVLALLTEESLGGKCLNNLGVTIASIADGCFGQQAADTAMAVISRQSDNRTAILPFGPPPVGSRIDQIPWLKSVCERAAFVARHSDSGADISSSHLVQAMVELQGPARQQLEEAGVTRKSVLSELNGNPPVAEERLPVDFQLTVEAVQPAAEPPASIIQSRILAAIDANLNRAREGLRVLEDAARFVLQDHDSTSSLKQLRHQLVATEQQLLHSVPMLHQCRNTESDVGTSLSTESEMCRAGLNDLVTANARRVQEALRSLEEFGKTVDSEFAAAIKQFRYRIYTLEQQLIAGCQVLELDDQICGDQAVQAASFGSNRPPVAGDGVLDEASLNRCEQNLRNQRRERLLDARLYVLITEQHCQLPWEHVVDAALRGGADVIQLREKHLSDEELIRRARWIASACSETGALFILNDRADLALAAGADGVHLGQEDGCASHARAVLDASQLIGVSTHQTSEITQACIAGADYLGVGPVFCSTTKSFQHFPGLAFVEQAAEHADRPWFAIGGIQRSNLETLLRHGAKRIAVSSAVIGAADPEQAARELHSLLKPADPDVPITVPFHNP